MTPPELALWSVLRTRPLGLKFRRQHPLGETLSLDFYCNDARLAIEVDGEAHDRGDCPARDGARDGLLAAWGILTLRIPAKAALTDLDSVLRHVLDIATARLPLHHPAAPGGPPPQATLGED